MGTALSTSGGLTDSQKAKAKELGLTNTEYYKKLLGDVKKETKTFKKEPAEKKPVKKKDTKSRFLKRRL